jgi:hypothetical protein
MGLHRDPGQPGSASSNPDAIANPDAEANPNPDAIANPDTEANPDPNATTHSAADASAHPIAASNTIPAPYPVTLGLTNAGANRGAVVDPGPPADSHGPDGSPTGATSGSQRRWRWGPAFYRCGASGISSSPRDRAHPAGRQDRGRFGRPG